MKISWFIIVLVLVALGTTFIYQNTQQADINYYEGHRYFEKTRYDKAILFYKKTLAIDPERIDALTDLAYSYQWTRDFEAAIKTFQKALSFKPNDIKLKIALAQTYSWIKKYDEAIELYKEIIEKSDDADSKKGLAEVYIWDKKFNKAKEILKPVLKNNPEDMQAKLLLAKALQYSGDVKKAIKLYQEILKQQKEGK